MKGKSIFTKAEAAQIIALIKKKVVANQNEQKRLRDKIRAIGFYATDFGIGGGYTEHDFLRVVKIIGEDPQTESIPLPEMVTVPKPEKIAASSHHKISFPPISNSNARILILGTMPGEKSLAMNQYYGHGGNQFWKIMFECFNIPYSDDYYEKKQLLLENRIALWDVLQFCQREGSSDNNIKAEIPNDFAQFLKQHPDIKTIIFNGNNARDFYDNFVGLKEGLNYHVLPSTSPANTWMTREEKIEEWKKVFLKLAKKTV